MCADTKQREGARNIKAETVIGDAMFSLLEHKKFVEIRVKEICEEALISRATFYTYYADKYDLLGKKLIPIKSEHMNWNSSYEQIEKVVNELVFKHRTIITNIVHGADSETLDILLRSILSALNLAVVKDKNENMNPEYIVLSNFYSGGVIYYLKWQVKNGFPPDTAPMNIYLYEIVKKFL